jgi:predicted MPP superfamily phosphohydrolase
VTGLPADTGSLRILLFHNPDHMLEPALQQFDLAFGGHVHGGQILLPLLGALHTQGTHLSRRRPSGWFRYGQTRAYIGRGLGEGVRLRFRCRPEVALVDIQKE